VRKRLVNTLRFFIFLSLSLGFTTLLPQKFERVSASGPCDVNFTVEDNSGHRIEGVEITILRATNNNPEPGGCFTDNQGKCKTAVPDLSVPKISCLYGDSGMGSGPPLFKYKATKTGYFRDIDLIKWNDVSIILEAQTPADCKIDPDKIQYGPSETVDLTGFVKSKAGQDLFVALIKPNGDVFGGQCLTTLSGDGGFSTSIALDDTEGEWLAAVFNKSSFGCSRAGSAICTSLTPFLVGLGASSRLNCSNSDTFKALNAERCACELGEDIRKICNTGCGPAKSECGKPECGGCSQCSDQVALASNPGIEGTWTAFGCLPNDPQSFVGVFLKLLVGIGGGLAFLILLRGGLLILTSQGDPEKINQGKDWITSAVFGLLFMIFATVILSIIGVDILRIPGFAR
jgi:hypothetical protein